MANASKNHLSAASHGKASGTGAMADESILDGRLGENMVLSNRDKSQHSDTRGLDGKAVQADQYQDHVANRLVDVSGTIETGNSSAGSGPLTEQSGNDSSLRSQEKA